ncbi:hypothetical protein PG988_000066 [Apiospora saccharicola]
MCIAHDEINRILAIQTFKSSNCLHLALEKRSSTRDDSVLLMLIDKSEENTLRAVNKQGLTPLHLAVAHNLCDDAELNIVQKLLAKCDEAIAADTPSGLGSPYRYHVHTCEEAAGKRRTGPVPGRGPRTEEIGPKAKGMGKPYGKADKNPDFAAGKKPQPSMEENQNRAHERPVGIGLGGDPFGGYQDTPEPGPTLLAPSGTFDIPPGPAPLSANEDKKKRTTSKKTGTAKIQPTEIGAYAIKQYLKKYILRTRSHDGAMQLLYGSHQEMQINFDLSNLNQTVDSISMLQITQGLHHQAFEDVLQYIAILQLRVEQPAIPSKREAGQRPTKSDGTGRTDLGQEGGNGLQIIVDDLKEPSHQDDAIESCLESVKGVETWDWKKLNLSPDVIQTAAPDAKIVHVYWSGKNAVLRAWSETEGLRMLKHLEEVHLHTQQGSDTKVRTQKNVAAFRQRMETGTSIRVVESKLKGDNPKKANSPIYTVKDKYERHKWVDIMENFAEFLQNAETRAATQITMKEPIRIAVIDDGVNSFDPTIDSKVKGGRSFSYRDKEQILVNPYYISSEGHGTAMAGFIRKICPNVEIHALRLDEYSVEQGKRCFTAASAEKAVRDAIERKVQIISMSWTIEKTEMNKTEVEKLEKAIANAAEERILMFCAAADGGAQRDRTYPAATARTKNIFKIGAAEPAGTATKWLGETLVDFIFPGHEVVRERQDDPGVTKYTPKTGSSVATALASGLAALVLYCVQLAAMSKKGAVGGRTTSVATTTQSLSNLAGYQALKNHETMKEAFLQIGTTKDKYIRVWERFEKPVKDAEGKPKDEWIDFVEALAETFTR